MLRQCPFSLIIIIIIIIKIIITVVTDNSLHVGRTVLLNARLHGIHTSFYKNARFTMALVLLLHDIINTIKIIFTLLLVLAPTWV